MRRVALIVGLLVWITTSAHAFVFTPPVSLITSSGAVVHNPVTLTFGSEKDNGDAGCTVCTFLGLSTNTANASRTVIVATWERNSTPRTITSVTIGGVTATPVVAATDNNTMISHYAANVPLGTTATVIITYSGAVVRGGVATWTTNDLGGGVTPFGTGTAIVNANPISTTVSTQANGSVACVAADGSGGSTTSTWTVVSKDWDTSIGTNSFSGGHVNLTTAGTVNPSNTFSNTPADAALACSSWGN